MGNLKFNGKSTEELGLFIQTPPSYTFPEKDISSVHIPGRNGDLYIDNKSYKNIDRTYAIAKSFKPGTTLYANTQEILSWLESSNGKYSRLEDSYDDEIYRLATFNMGGSFVNYYDEATSIEITFQCKPQRFLKTGENQLHYDGHEITIENITGYTSLPSIELINVPSEVEDILMMTVTDSENQNVSNITLNHVAQDQPDNVTVVIDSEEQTIIRKFSDRNVNVASYVGLNGLPFPELRKGETKIKLKKYESEDTGPIKSYDVFMNEKAEKIEGLYKPIMRIANENEKMVLVRSWKTMVNEAKRNNIKESYKSYAQTIAEEFTFPSANDVLDSIGESTMEFTGNLSDNGLPSYDFVNISETADGKSYIIKAGKSGYFMVKGDKDWKTLKYYSNGTTLESALANSNVVQVMFYPVKQGTNQLDFLSTEELPKWLSYEIVYSNDSSHSPQRINIVTIEKFSEQDPNIGYYYIPKSEGLLAGLLSKSKWIRNIDNNGNPVIQVLKSFEWNSSKKKFTTAEGINKKTDASYAFKYLKEIKQYKFDSDNNEIQYFTIEDNSPVASRNDALTNFILKAEKEGWYLLVKGDNEDTLSYSYKFVHDDIGTITGTENFKVSYIQGDPNRTYEKDGRTIHRPLISYEKEKGWPEWLYPYPLNENYQEFDINATYVTFKLNNIDKGYENKFYMFFGANDESERNVLKYTSPKKVNDTTYVIQNSDEELISVAKTDYSFYVYQINEVPTPFKEDRSFVVYDEEGHVTEEVDIDVFNSEDHYLTVHMIGDLPEREGDEDTRQLSYRAKKSGYFKWNNNSAWVYKHADDESNNGLLMTSLKDDTTIYYTEHLPEYSSDDIEKLYDKIELIPLPKETSTGGENPTSVEIKVKEGNDGYYRANNNVNWKYYKSGETILISKVNETNRIYHLIEKDDEELNNMQINIIPRWWML